MTTEKEKLFKEEVKQGLHPDWTVDQNDELVMIGEMPVESDKKHAALCGCGFLHDPGERCGPW